MPSPDNHGEPLDPPEVLAARGEVELAKAELENRLYQASDSGRRAIARVAEKARPVVVLAAVAIGVLVVARWVASKRKPAWRRGFEEAPVKPSLFKVVVGSALRGALRVVATRLAEQATLRMIEASEPQADDETANAEHARG